MKNKIIVGKKLIVNKELLIDLLYFLGVEFKYYNLYDKNLNELKEIVKKELEFLMI